METKYFDNNKHIENSQNYCKAVDTENLNFVIFVKVKQFLY